MSHLDGNVLAGAISDVLGFEATAAQAQCQSCGDVAVVAQAVVYAPPVGMVARCRHCDDVLLVVVERAGQTVVNLRGMRWLPVDDR